MRELRKMRSVLLAVVVGFLAYAAPMPASALSPADFIARTKAWAQAEERAVGVPASVAMAQSILESGWGESELAKNANNWFGIKCGSTASPHQNGCYEMQTWEVDGNGNRYTTTSRFRKYDDPEKSFLDHGRFLTASRYSKAFDHTNNPDRFIFEVHMGGYATDPLYANKVIDLMQRHNLYEHNVTPAATGNPDLVIRPAARANVGATANVTGLLSPGGAGRSVWTQAMTPNGWSTSQRVTTGSRGHFTIPLTYGADSVGVHRFRVQAAAPQGTLTSSEFTIERLGALRPNAVGEVFVGDTARLKGTAVGYGGRTITAQVLRNGTWRNHSSGTVASNGSFDLPLTSSSAGATSYRVTLTTAQGTRLNSGTVRATWKERFSITAHSAGTKAAGQDSNTWGTVTGAPNATVWTEVQTPSGWSRSQTRTADANGYFVIPLTYGRNNVGTFTWRVGVDSPEGVRYSSTFTLTRVAAPRVIASSAGTKIAGQDTNTWGIVSGAPDSEVWSEVNLGNRWSRSQTRTTDSDGRFVIPLTYGARTPGTYSWRVAVRTPLGVFYSDEFTLRRTAAPVTVTAASAGTKRVGQLTNTWGTAAGARRAEVWTEVQLSSGWSRSQTRTTDGSGYFVIPLTYGANQSGTHRWRVGVRTSQGVFYSNEFTLRRTN